MVETTARAARRHHYVPRFHLDRFADLKGRLRAFDRKRGETITTSSKGVAVERDFYRLSEATGLSATLLEETLSRQESEAAAAIRDVVDEGRVSHSNREALATHLAFQYLRTRRHRIFTRDVTDRMATQEAQITLARRLSEGDFKSESERAIAQQFLGQLTSGELVVSLHEDQLLGWMFRYTERLFEEFHSGWNWVLVVLNAPRFVTTDNPICLLGEPEFGGLSSNVGIRNALEVWFTLDPRHALVLSRDHSIGSLLIGLADSHVRSINLRLALESERWTFFRPGSEGVKGLQIPPERPQFEEVTIESRDCGAGTTADLVRLGARKPRVPNERLLSGRRLRPF